MIGYVDVQEQVDKDFHRALLKASLRRWKDRLRRASTHDRLLSFDEAKSAQVGWTQAYRGMRTVEVEKIAGSVGRYKDFDCSFLPIKKSMAKRWSRVDHAYHRGDELPAVSLYKIGEAYFVRDGNHRVSVAKYHNAAAVDAEIVELRGHTRTQTEQSAACKSGAPAHRSQDRSESGASCLRDLWQRHRPGLWREGVRPVT
jgi:hypothetical protein